MLGKAPLYTHTHPHTHTHTPWSGLCVDVFVLDAMFGLCVEANVPAGMQSCLFPTFDALSVCVCVCACVSACERVFTLLVSMHQVGNKHRISNYETPVDLASWTVQTEVKQGCVSHDCFHPNRLNSLSVPAMSSSFLDKSMKMAFIT